MDQYLKSIKAAERQNIIDFINLLNMQYDVSPSEAVEIISAVVEEEENV